MSTPDFVDLIDALRAHDVRFLIVGGYALGIHGHPRATKDLDVWVEANAENAVRLVRAPRDFGAPLHGLSANDFEREGTGLQVGVPPGRIGVVTQVRGAVVRRGLAAPPRSRVLRTPGVSDHRAG